MKINKLIKKLKKFKENYGNKEVIFKHDIGYDPMIGNYPYEDLYIKFVSLDDNEVILTEEKYYPKNPTYKIDEEYRQEEEKHKKEFKEFWETLSEIINSSREEEDKK